MYFIVYLCALCNVRDSDIKYGIPRGHAAGFGKVEYVIVCVKMGNVLVNCVQT